jgi:hypothetical protein
MRYKRIAFQIKVDGDNVQVTWPPKDFRKIIESKEWAIAIKRRFNWNDGWDLAANGILHNMKYFFQIPKVCEGLNVFGIKYEELSDAFKEMLQYPTCLFRVAIDEPEDILKNGFNAPGQSLVVLNHINMYRVNEVNQRLISRNTAFISFSTNFREVHDYACILSSKHSKKKVYIYALDLRRMRTPFNYVIPLQAILEGKIRYLAPNGKDGELVSCEEELKPCSFQTMFDAAADKMAPKAAALQEVLGVGHVSGELVACVFEGELNGKDFLVIREIK